MGVKIPENLAMAASMSQLQHTTYFIVYSTTEQFCDSFPLNSTDAYSFSGTTLLQFTEVYPTLVTFSFLNCIATEKGQMLKANGSQACLSLLRQSKKKTKIICLKKNLPKTFYNRFLC